MKARIPNFAIKRKAKPIIVLKQNKILIFLTIHVSKAQTQQQFLP